MAGYSKIWTTLLTEEWFIKLPINAKGVYLWLLIDAKRQGGTGIILYKGWTKLANQLYLNRQTLSKIIQSLSKIGKLKLLCDKYNNVRIEIPNYLKWQEIRRLYDSNYGSELSKKDKVIVQNDANNIKELSILKNKADFLQKSNKDKNGNKPGYVRKIVTAPGTNIPTEIWVPDPRQTKEAVK